MKNWKKVGLVVGLAALLAVALFGCGGIFNQAPTATIQANPVSGKAPLTVNFVAKATDDGTIVAYEWNFGDGANAVGETVQHVYKQTGTYTVTLKVTDDGGKMGTASQTINVLNPGPTCDGIGVKNLTGYSCCSPFCVNDTLQFSVLNARHPANIAITSYKWNFGDGNGAYGATVQHRFALAGSYTVTVTLTDAQGVSNSFSKNIIVKECCACLPKIGIVRWSGSLNVGQDITLKGVFKDGYCGVCSVQAVKAALSAKSLVNANPKNIVPCPPPPPSCTPCPGCHNGTWEWRVWLNNNLIGSGYGRFITVTPCQTGSMTVYLYYTCEHKSTYAKKVFTIKP